MAITLGLGVSLLAAEGLVRVAFPGHEPRRTDYTIRPVSKEPPSWVYEPGSRAVFEWDGDPIGVLPEGARAEVPINAEGLRGPLPSPGRATVVFLGDSFTFGEGVELADTFVERVGAHLTSAVPGAPAVVNAGVAGHGTVEEAARLEQLLARFRPRAVVLVHVPNDAIPWDASAQRAMDLLNVPAGGFSRLLSLATAQTSSGGVEDWYRSYYVGERSEDWARSREAFLWMAEQCRAASVRFAVVTFPLMHRLDDYPLGEITEAVAAAARLAHVPHLDLLPGFAGQDASTLWAHPAERHPNARAHAIAAERIAPFVVELLQ